MTAALIVVGSYLLGSIPASYLAVRLGAGIDLRQHGSKNLGATNVYRVLGWRYAVPVGAFDVAKGLVPVLIALSREGAQQWIPVAAGVAAVLGHVFPLYLGFRGGKGVATAAGVVVALAPLALAVSAVVWLAVVAVTRYVSVASITGAASFPVVLLATRPDERYTLAAGTVLAVFIFYTHRGNIRRLLAGTENRIGHRPETTGETS